MTFKHSAAGVFLLFCAVIFSGKIARAQAPEKLNPSEIHQAIKKLNFLGSALYLAAHPDDENTRLISYLSNNVHARTAYLSLTRGDGGQNLIGPEIRELLGVIRTNELLQARSVDGGEQIFTRANDFGYSKHPDETFAIWNKEEVLADVVWAIRKFQPDIIVNRFDHRSPGSTHGHHTGSAMLSHEAFDMVGDKNVYPEQLKYVEAWQPRRLFFNTSWWFYGSREKFAEADKTNLTKVDVGVYYPAFGKSNTEIAALSRSKHVCQGFGNTGTRGQQQEYLEILKGDMPKEEGNLFEGINTTWTRVEGGAPIGKILEQVETNFDFTNPSASVDGLVRAFTLIKKLPESHWKTIKEAEIKAIILACSGLFFEAKTETQFSNLGDRVGLSIETINRSDAEVQLVGFKVHNTQLDTVTKLMLRNNASNVFKKEIELGSGLDFTAPYWLFERGSLGMYKVEDQKMRGIPVTPHQLRIQFDLSIEGEEVSFVEDVIYKFNDPEKGEVYRSFEIVPQAAVEAVDKVIIFADDDMHPVRVRVKNNRENLVGNLKLQMPKGWRTQEPFFEVEMAQKGDEATFTFHVEAPPVGQVGEIMPYLETKEGVFTMAQIEIDYDHIPYQTVILPATARVVKLEIEKRGNNIAYIPGAGDVVPENLRQIGYKVTEIQPDDISVELLQQFDAVLLGIRAYNKHEALVYKQKDLLKYVELGGTLVAQYNTTWNRKVDQIGPYPFQISRDRVTKEEAPVRFLVPDHEVLNFPNKITQADFDGWVQERGLYFANDWDEAYTPILESNDPGEDPKQGALLVAKYGKGNYVYTGISFFRVLPAGTPGAYRLLANIISLGQNPAK